MPAGPRPGVTVVDGHVLVAGHAAVRAVLADPRTCPDNALDAVTPSGDRAARADQARLRLPPTLANNGSASHPRSAIVGRPCTRPRRERRPGSRHGAAGRQVAASGAHVVVDLHAERPPTRRAGTARDRAAGRDVGLIK
ncbi:hypothetical protein ACFQX7_36155, partial [Luedemannella flava]